MEEGTTTIQKKKMGAPEQNQTKGNCPWSYQRVTTYHRDVICVTCLLPLKRKPHF